MRTYARLLSFISALFGIFSLVRSPKGAAGGVLWLPKLWAGAWAPFLAVLGGLGALFSLPGRDVPGVAAGLFGAFVGIRYTQRVTRRKDDPFERAFGTGWEKRIPPKLRARLPRPYVLVQPLPPAGVLQKDIDVGDGASLLCDLWFPPPDVPRTRLSVIFLHGSLWQAVDKDFLSRPLFRRLVRQGHVVMDLAYSLAPAANIYTMLGEVRQAVAWLKENAARLEIDPEAVVLMGASGGAHLALLSAYTPNSPLLQPQGLDVDTSVRAVISLFGITDLAQFFREYGQANPGQPESSADVTPEMQPRIHDRTAMDRFITRARMFPAYRYSNMPGGALLLVNLFGGTLREIPHVYELLSPITHVRPGCPPTLLIAGDDDFVIDASHSRRLNSALRAAGVPSVYVEFPDSVHGFDQYFGVSRRASPASQMAISDIEKFLALMV